MSKQIEDYPIVFDAKIIAEIMGLSLRTAYLVMDHPEFPLIKIGRCKRVERDGFFVWLEKQSMNS
ncbi:hypothetical protein QF028_002597 [Neobacillus sp. B4I6]|uniref:DNA-binding protein n=1 Tax=Neobacillus sp. B4I6 TaxID=3373925 RepID=UPI003D254022